MRSLRICFACVFALLFFRVVDAQAPLLQGNTSAAASSNSSDPQKDAQAFLIATQVLSSGGWAASRVPSTILASGNLIRTDGNVQQTESFTLKQRGPSQQRFELQDSSGTTTAVVNGLNGSIVSFDAKTSRLRPQAAMSFQSPTFPFLSDLMNVADPAVEVGDLGVDTIDGVLCHGISVARQAAKDDKLASFRDLAAPLKIWVSQQSGLPVRIDFIRLADDNPYLAMHFSRSYSDYRIVDGVEFPYTQEEYFGQHLMYRLEFTSIQFNASVTDADFQITNR